MTEKRKVKRVSVDNQEEVLKDLMLKVIDRTNSDYDYIFHVLEEGLSDLHFGRKIVSLNFDKVGVKVHGNRLMLGFLFDYVITLKKEREGDK